MDTHNPIIIRKAEQTDLESIHSNDAAMYRKSVGSSETFSKKWLEDYFNTFNDGICVAEDTTTKKIVGHGMCFSFNKRYDETKFEFIFNSHLVSSLHTSHAKTVFGKSFIVLPEYRKYHVAYGLFKWMVLSITKKYPEVQYVLALCEKDNRSRKLHYVMGYKPKHVLNNLFNYVDSGFVDGILMEIPILPLLEGFRTDSYKKWFGVTGSEPNYIY